MSKPTTAKTPTDKRDLQGKYETVLETLTEPVVLKALDKVEEANKLIHAIRVRVNYKDGWRWGPGAEYLYRELIRALGLEELEEGLVSLAKPRRGRKQERELASRIWTLKSEGKTVPQIKSIFESEDQYFSAEKIESYLKTRRKKQKD
jgi:hypothetical protein